MEMVRSVDAKETEDRTSSSSSHLDYVRSMSQHPHLRHVRIIFFFLSLSTLSPTHTHTHTNTGQANLGRAEASVSMLCDMIADPFFCRVAMGCSFGSETRSHADDYKKSMVHSTASHDS